MLSSRSGDEYGENWTPTETLIQSSIIVYVLLLVTGLQLRAVHLWSESRILRKLRGLRLRHDDVNIARDAYGSNTRQREWSREEIFSRLYVSLAKGRHRRYGRLYSVLLLLFFYSIDLLDTIPTRKVEFFSSTEVIMALRISIYWGSLTVLGARPLHPQESAIVSVACLLYAFSLIWTYIFQVRISRTVRIVLLVIRLISVLPSVFHAVVEAHRLHKNKSCHISSIANAIRVSPTTLTDLQRERFNSRWDALVTESAQRGGPPLKGEPRGSYWPVGNSRWEAFAYLVLCLTNGIAWLPPTAKYVPEIVVVEAFELFSFVLLLVNDTQVEPRLFIELLATTEAFYNSATGTNQLSNTLN